MGRFFIGVALLLAFLLLGLQTSASMNDIHTTISQNLTAAAEKSLSGSFDDAVAYVRRAKESWDDHWHVSASVADHGPMDEIDGLFSQLEVYQQTEAVTEFAAYCKRLSSLVSAMAEAHFFTWWNLL